MKVGHIVEIAVPSLESKWLHGLEAGTKVRVHQLFEDEPRRVAVEVGGVLRMVLPSELREVVEVSLPELPEPSVESVHGWAYTADQLRQYARDAIAAAEQASV